MRNVAVIGSPVPVRKSTAAADVAMRRLLFIPERPVAVREKDVNRLFSTSIALSTLRCLVSYVVLPILTPALGAAAGAGPAIGIPLSVVALVFDVRGIRRFWLADHRLRWQMTALYAVVMAMVAGLLIVDIVRLGR